MKIWERIFCNKQQDTSFKKHQPFFGKKRLHFICDLSQQCFIGKLYVDYFFQSSTTKENRNGFVAICPWNEKSITWQKNCFGEIGSQGMILTTKNLSRWIHEFSATNLKLIVKKNLRRTTMINKYDRMVH